MCRVSCLPPDIRRRNLTHAGGEALGRTGVLLIVGIFASLAWIGSAATLPLNALSLSALGAVVAVGVAFSPGARAAADRFLSSPPVQIGPGFIVAGLLVWCTGA